VNVECKTERTSADQTAAKRYVPAEISVQYFQSSLVPVG